MWHEGVIGIPVKGSDKMKAAHYHVRCFDEANEYGINKGKISQLIINIEEKTKAYYDE